MSNPEVQRNTPNGSPAKSSDTLLKSFRATLNQRWNEFDQATLQEAQAQVNNHILGGFTDAKSQRDKDANFIKAKATFDEAMSALTAIDTDAKLKQTLETPGRLGSTINSLKDYLAKADAQKSYNAVLSHTLADLTGLKAQMTEKVEDKKDAEIAKAATLAVAGTGATLGNEVMKGLSGAVADGTKAVQQEIASVKKNPGKTIAEFLGFGEDSILSDYREALAEKKAGGFDGIFSGIKLWFYGFMAKLTGFNIAKSLTPEELKLAGINAPTEGKKPETQQLEAEKGKNDNLKYVASVDMLLKFGQSREERAENVLGVAGQILKEPKFNELSIGTLKKGFDIRTKKFDISTLGSNEKTIFDGIAADPTQKIKALNLIARLFLDTSNSIQKQVSSSLLKGGDNISIRSSILSASQNLRKFTPFGSIDLSNPQAMIQEGAGKYIPTIDPKTQELSGELAEDFNASMGKKNALWIFGFARNQPVPLDIKSIDNHFKTDNPDLSKDPEDQQKLREILQFGVNLRSTIANDPVINLGEGKAVTKAIEHVFTLSDLGMLYTFLDGKTDPATMNSLEKGFLIMKVADLVGINDKVLFGKYSTAIVNAISGFETPLDPQVKKVFGDMLSYATDKTGNAITDVGEVIWGSAKKNPGVALGLIGAMLFGPWFSKRTALVGPLSK